jgi:putative ABC transport system substrate-binding protein
MRNESRGQGATCLGDGAPRRGVIAGLVSLNGPEEIAAALDGTQAVGATALNVLASSLLYRNRKIILDRSAAPRLPAIYQWPETAEEGGFAAYGPRFAKVNRQLARQVVKVLRGAKPADIPVELVINMKTANALGLTILPSILARADEVIE